MFEVEEFQKKIKAIADNVPEHLRTTLGNTMYWIISQAFILHFQPMLLSLEDRITALTTHIQEMNTAHEGLRENGHEERGLQESQGDTETLTKAPRRRKELA